MAMQAHSSQAENGLSAQRTRPRKQAAVNVIALEQGEYWLYYGDDNGDVDNAQEPVNVGTCSAQEFDSVLESWVDLLDTSAMSAQELAALEKKHNFLFDRVNWPLGHRLFALQQCVTQLDYFPLVRQEQTQDTDEHAAVVDLAQEQEAVEV